MCEEQSCSSLDQWSPCGILSMSLQEKEPTFDKITFIQQILTLYKHQLDTTSNYNQTKEKKKAKTIHKKLPYIALRCIRPNVKFCPLQGEN